MEIIGFTVEHTYQHPETWLGKNYREPLDQVSASMPGHVPSQPRQGHTPHSWTSKVDPNRSFTSFHSWRSPITCYDSDSELVFSIDGSPHNLHQEENNTSDLMQGKLKLTTNLIFLKKLYNLKLVRLNWQGSCRTPYLARMESICTKQTQSDAHLQVQ